MSEWVSIDVVFVQVLLGVLAASIVGVLFRLARGPSLADRVVALDMIALAFVAMTGVYAVATSNEEYLRVAMVAALVNFVGTVAFAYYLQRRQEVR